MPVDRGALDAQLREIGEGERWWEYREFRELPYVLHPDERLRGITVGKMLGRRRPRVRPSPRWLLVATDERLLCLRHERFARKQIDIHWSQIVRVQQRSGFRFYQITIQTPERSHRIRIPKAEALRFTAALSTLVPRPTIQGLGPEMEPLSWIPGMATVARLPPFAGIASKVAMLSPPDYAPREYVERLEASVDRLQAEVERLQQQVAFVEDLLHQRAPETALQRAAGPPG
jgi:hypothetical protein